MQETFHQYHLITELANKYSHSTYLASPTNPKKGHGEHESQMVLTLFTSSLFRSPHEHENLLKKIQCIQDIEHPHVASILDMGIEQEQPFVVREYWLNGSLRSRMKQIAPDHLELADALTITLQVGQALVYAHERNIVHGNIKPENILFDANGQAILADFSLVGSKDALIRDQISQEYAFCYLAPEQFAGVCDSRSDQYALGCLAYELITGHVPFASQGLTSMMGLPSNAQPVLLSERVADLPPLLEMAVLKTLARDPSERFFDFSVFLEAIESVLSLPPAFSLSRSPSSEKKRTISHGAPITIIEIHKDSTRRPATRALALSGLKKRTHRRGSVTVPAKHRVLELGLLLSVIMAAICSALWLSGIFMPNTTTASLRIRKNGIQEIATQTMNVPTIQPSVQVMNTPAVQFFSPISASAAISASTSTSIPAKNYNDWNSSNTSSSAQWHSQGRTGSFPQRGWAH